MPRWNPTCSRLPKPYQLVNVWFSDGFDDGPDPEDDPAQAVPEIVVARIGANGLWERHHEDRGWGPSDFPAQWIAIPARPDYKCPKGGVIEPQEDCTCSCGRHGGKLVDIFD